MKKLFLAALIFTGLLFSSVAHAALATYTGSFLTSTSTGNQAITGVGFTPKIVMFYGGAKADSQGAYNSMRVGLGVATSSSAQWAQSVQYNWTATAAASQSARSLSTTKCFSYVTATGTTTYTTTLDAAFVSQDADGFTVNITTTDGTARRIFFVAIGGSDLSANVGTFNTGTSTGNVAVTGVGFQPDIIFIVSSISATSDGSASNGTFSFGAAKSSSSRFVSNWLTSSGVNPSLVKSYQIGTKVVGRMNTTSVISMDMDLVSQDSDGFTLNHTTADGTNRKMGYFALQGIQSKIGSTLQKTTVGTTAVTGVGFTPKLLIMSSVNNTSTTSASGGGGLIIGTATSTTQRNVAGNDVRDGSSGNFSQGKTSEALVMGHYTGTSTTADSTHPTVSGEADLASFDADGFTLNWTSTDGVARESYYVAIGQSDVAPGGTTGTMYLF